MEDEFDKPLSAQMANNIVARLMAGKTVGPNALEISLHLPEVKVLSS
jgi:hypothetical protein